MNLNKQTIILIVISLAIAIGLGWPGLSSWQAQKKALDTATARLSQLERRQIVVNDLVTAKTNLSQAALLVDSVLADSSTVPAVMSQVGQIASENGVSVSALQFAGSVSDKGDFVKVQVAVKGSYEQIKNFLQAVESSGGLLLVGSLRLLAESQVSSNIMTATLDISNPYFAGSVPETTDGAYFKSSEFNKLISTLNGYKLYTPLQP